MKSTLAIAAMAALITGSVAIPAPSIAKNYRHHRVYQGRGGHHYRRCGGGNGAVGTIAGGAGGAVLGSVLGGGTVGTIAGGVGGALLGRHFDKQHTRRRNGC